MTVKVMQVKYNVESIDIPVNNTFIKVPSRVRTHMELELYDFDIHPNCDMEFELMKSLMKNFNIPVELLKEYVPERFI